jgi:protein SCO1/2
VIPGFTVTLPGGSVYDTAADGLRPTVLFFGYTNCPDVCPTTLADWKRAKARLGADGARVRFLFVTVDPARDTPVVAERYAKQFDDSFVGLSGDSSTTANIMRVFGVSSARESTSDSSRYLVSHSAQAFLVDAAGRLIAMYSFGMGWDVLAADLESIL